jgi:hypothetical protein
MEKTDSAKSAERAEAIARMADRGEDISRFFTEGKMMPPLQGPHIIITSPIMVEPDDGKKK